MVFGVGITGFFVPKCKKFIQFAFIFAVLLALLVMYIVNYFYRHGACPHFI